MSRKRSHTSSRPLQSFSNSKDHGLESDSLYDHYAAKLKEHRDNKIEAANQQAKEGQNYWQARVDEGLKTKVGAPDFEEYFESKSKGKHPFDDKELYPDADLLEDQFEEEKPFFTEDGEEILSKEELLGRFYNHTLTPQ